MLNTCYKPQIFVYPIAPVAKPRMTQCDKWKLRPGVARYFDFKDQCRLYQVYLPPFGATVRFEMPMPRSWSLKKKNEMAGRPHQQVPDLDNLIKGLADAVYKDDSKIWHYHGLSKVWSWSPAIVIEY